MTRPLIDIDVDILRLFCLLSVPPPLTELGYNGVTDTLFNLIWNDVSGYFINIEYYPENDPSDVTTVTGLTGTQYFVSGLQPITTYKVSVAVASSSGGVSPAVQITVQTGQLTPKALNIFVKKHGDQSVFSNLKLS